LTNWVLDGITTLTQTAEKEGDGALGWSTKAEVFTLGMRIFCASEVVMRWGGRERTEVVEKMRIFADVGVDKGVHGLWVERAESVLNREVVRVLKRVNEGLLELRT
jgi:hypothetical protein